MPSSSSNKSKTLHRNLEAKLAALDGPEWDSSDDEEQEENIVEKKTKTGAPKSSSKTQKDDDKSNVIYLGHLPVGFEEGELRGFLSQFGQVSRLKLARSKKTGSPKGYAFCRFEDAEVAAIVAETMSGYLLLEKRLVCHVVPPEKVHPGMFAKQPKTTLQQRQLSHAQKVNQKRTKTQLSKITQRLVRREKKKRTVLQQLGIDYDFPGYGKEEETKQVESTEESIHAKRSKEKKIRKVSMDEENTEIRSKRKRKMSHEKKSETQNVTSADTPTNKKESETTTRAQTDVKKKKKKSSKKRRKSAP